MVSITSFWASTVLYFVTLKFHGFSIFQLVSGSLSLYLYRLIEMVSLQSFWVPSVFYTTLICHIFSTLHLIYNISHISYFLTSSLREPFLSPLYVSLRSYFMVSQLFNWSIKLPWDVFSHLSNILWAQVFGEPFVSLFKVNWRWTR